MADNKIVTKRGIYLYIDGKEINNDLRSIQAEFRRLQNEQARMTVGSERYVQAGRKIRALDAIIQEHRRQWRSTGEEIGRTRSGLLSIGKLTDSFNRYFGVITSFIAGLTGMTFAMRKCVDDFAQLEEEEANVRKYTGMTKEEVKELNEAFKRMDTRTARARLNQLAADAGRLGIQGKEQLLEFVEAANTINVALGEDLGDDAVKDIGKLAQMFGADTEKGLKGGMLAVASAINEVAQNSSAAEKYLVNFTARVAGTGKQAGIAIPQIMGYASVMDQNMLRSEMAATALQKVWLKMYQEPEKFARLAGKSVEEFTRDVTADANAAFLSLMESLGKSGGLMELAPIFEEMKLDGTEAVGVLNTIVASVGRIRSEQEVATQAFEEATSATEEYNVQNNTLQATIDKAKKRFQEYAYTLGEKLAPYMGQAISKSSVLLDLISVTIGFLARYGAGLARVTVALLAYVSAQRLQAAWQSRTNALTTVSVAINTTYRAALAALAVAYNLLLGRLFAARVAMVAFNNAVKMNPLGLLLSALAAAGMAIAHFVSKQREANKYTRQMRAEILREETAANKLFTALKLAGQGTEQRARLIAAVNRQYGDYLPNLLSEEASLKEIRKAQEAVNAAIRANIALKTQKEAVDNIERDALEEKASEIDDIRKLLARKLPASEVETALSRIVTQADKAVEKGFNAKQALQGVFKNLKDDFFGGNVSRMDPHTAGEIEDYVDLVYKTAAKIAKEKAKYEPFITPPKARTTLPEVVITGSTQGKGGGTSPAPDAGSGDTDALKRQTDALEAAYRERVNMIKHSYIERKITERQMQDDLYTEETRYLYARMELYKQNGLDISEIEGSLFDKIIAKAKELSARKVTPAVPTGIEDEEEPEDDPLWARLAKGTEVQMEANEELYRAGLISYEEYLRRKAELQERAHHEELSREEEQEDRKERIKEAAISAFKNITSAASNFIQAAEQRDISKVEKKYAALMEMAEGDSEAQAALEEKKQAEIQEIKKKYADKQFALNVLNITADTALAAMRAYSAMAGIPVVGPALGVAAAAAAVAAGAAQIAVAKQQQEQAANMWDGGYTGEGGKYEKRRLIQTHGGEFVANKRTVQILRPVFDIMDYAQRTGNVAALTSPEMARALGGPDPDRRTPAQGGPVSPGPTANTTPDILRALAANTRVIALMRKKLEEPFVGEVYVDGPRGVKQNLSDYDKLIKNATR